jgi:N-acetylglucosaminyldiphosphoundecaprenol N-acetyl-beta-D-mannosaminyltransferase
MRVDSTNYKDATQRILTWAKARESKYVCAANVHMTMEVYDSSEFARIVNQAALITPDGMPLVWGLKLLGLKNASRVYGPTLTLHVCQAAASDGIPIGLYGGTPDSLIAFTSFLEKNYPGIQIGCSISPPFRPLTPDEDASYLNQIIDSEVRILFVGIGCPRQEQWMSERLGRIPAVMLGVGAAFDFHSGRVKQAPGWIQSMGLEWLFRLAMEPKRLWGRYTKHNPRFVALFVRQLLGTYLGREAMSTADKPR